MPRPSLYPNKRKATPISFRLDARIFRRVEAAAKQLDESRSDVISLALDKYVDALTKQDVEARRVDMERLK